MKGNIMRRLIALAFLIAFSEQSFACSTCLTASINGSEIPSESVVTDSNGNSWTVVSGVPKENGTTAGTVTGVNTLLWFNGTIYADTSTQWYKWSGTAWTTITADPRVTTLPIADLGTASPNSSIVDTSGNVWAIDSSGTCYENGTAVSLCTGITKLTWMNTSIYKLVSSSWSRWGGSSWTSISKDPRYSFQLGMNFSQYDCGTPWQFSAGTIRINTNFYSFWNGKQMYSIRLPVLWERLQPTLGGSLDTTSGSNGTGFVGDIEAEVNNAASHQQTVLLDVHDYGKYTPYNSSGCTIASGHGDPTTCTANFDSSCGCYGVGGSTLTTTEFGDFWKKVATVFGATNSDGSRVYPNILGYDLMNEPAIGTGAQWTSFAQAAINSIRTVDTYTPIFVEGEGFSTVNNWTGPNPTGTLDTLTDSANKIVFSGHNYANQDSQSYITYGGGDTAQSMVNNYTGSSSQFANWCKTQVTNGVAIGCHIGEGGVTEGSDGGGTNGQNLLTMMDNVVSKYQSDNFPFHYWQGGPCEAAASDTSTTAWSGSSSSLSASPMWSGEGSVNGLKTYVPNP